MAFPGEDKNIQYFTDCGFEDWDGIDVPEAHHDETPTQRNLQQLAMVGMNSWAGRITTPGELGLNNYLSFDENITSFQLLFNSLHDAIPTSHTYFPDYIAASADDAAQNQAGSRNDDLGYQALGYGGSPRVHIPSQIVSPSTHEGHMSMAQNIHENIAPQLIHSPLMPTEVEIFLKHMALDLSAASPGVRNPTLALRTCENICVLATRERVSHRNLFEVARRLLETHRYTSIIVSD
ncbi:hypothetical protein RUND412_004243 [Rhizina undulata]